MELLDQQRECPIPHAEDDPHYRHRSYSAGLGSGEVVFATAASELGAWGMHRRVGFDVLGTAPTALPGATVLLTFRISALWVTAACRVVESIDTPDGRGFTYATLPLHPERGWQRFLVSKHGDGRVSFSVSSASQPQGLARAGGPVTRLLQRRAVARYLQAMRELSRTSSSHSG